MFLSVSVIASVVLSFGGAGTVELVKDWRLPIARSISPNPASLPEPCRSRKFTVTHRRNIEGLAYDIEVEPHDSADLDLVPYVREEFRRWKFKVPSLPEWREEYLDVAHVNEFETWPNYECEESKTRFESLGIRN